MITGLILTKPCSVNVKRIRIIIMHLSSS